MINSTLRRRPKPSSNVKDIHDTYALGRVQEAYLLSLGLELLLLHNVRVCARVPDVWSGTPSERIVALGRDDAVAATRSVLVLSVGNLPARLRRGKGTVKPITNVSRCFPET